MENKLFIISGNSGAGKSSVMNSSCLKDNKIVTSTTRPKRDGEIEGEDYYFVSEEEFEHLISSDKMIAVAKYAGNYYGIHEDELFSRLEEGDAYCIVDFLGKVELERVYSLTTSIFIYSDINLVPVRLANRGDAKTNIGERILKYYEEIENSVDYDYVIKNNEEALVFTTDILNTIVLSEKFYGEEGESYNE